MQGRASGSWASVGPYGYALPAALVLALVSVYPLVYSLAMSLFDWDWGSRFNFVGLRNYTDLLTDAAFWGAMLRTLYFTAGAVGVEVVLGLGLALLLSRMGRGAGLVRAVLLFPLLVSAIIVSVVGKVMLDSTLGVVPYLLEAAGLPETNFLGSTTWAMPTIVGMDTWWQTGFVFLILSAGLASIPAEPLEAASIDGANAWQLFRYVILPLLKPLIVVVAVFRAIECLKVFALIFGTTGGGPRQSTEALQVLTYRTAFEQLHMSKAMTIMVLSSILVLTIVAAYLALGRGVDER